MREIRCFLGIACPLTNSMQGLHRYLEQYGGKGLRLVSDFNLHITLRFLGAVDETRIPRLTEAVQHKLERHGEFELELFGLGFMSTSMWLGVAPSTALSQLVDGLTTALATQGFTAERRAYHPHVTVARFHKDAKIKLSKMQKIYAGAEWGTVSVREFHLYMSETLSEGARYTVLESFRV